MRQRGVYCGPVCPSVYRYVTCVQVRLVRGCIVKLISRPGSRVITLRAKLIGSGGSIRVGSDEKRVTMKGETRGLSSSDESI